MQSVKTVAAMMETMEPPTITDKDLQKKDKVFAYDPQAAFEKVKRWLIKEPQKVKNLINYHTFLYTTHLLSFIDWNPNIWV